MHVNSYPHTHISTYVHVLMHICAYAHMYCTYAHMYCTYAHMHMHICTHAHIAHMKVRTYTHIPICTSAHLHICTSAHFCTSAQVYTSAHLHTSATLSLRQFFFKNFQQIPTVFQHNPTFFFYSFSDFKKEKRNYVRSFPLLYYELSA